MVNIREDVHALVASCMDRTDKRKAEPIICDYLADLARLFVNLLEEESQYQNQGIDVEQQQADWSVRIKEENVL